MLIFPKLFTFPVRLSSRPCTMLLSIYHQLRVGDYFGTVVTDTEGNDVYVQSAYVSPKHSGQLLIKRKRSFVDCQALASREVFEVILSLHVLTGCDHNSGFYGHGKKVVMDKVINHLESRELLSSCSKELPLQEKVLEDFKSLCIKV